MHEIFDNPLWWVLPAILIASWIVNNRSPKTEAKSNKESEAKKDVKTLQAPEQKAVATGEETDK